MIKNEDSNKKEPQNYTESSFSKLTHETSNLISSPNAAAKKLRKDAKGIPILKKSGQNKKTLHHLYFVDHLDPSHNLEQVEEIECFKKYNQDGEEEAEEEEIIKVRDDDVKEENVVAVDKEELIETKTIYTQKCCIIF